jgi:hypothetical protein
MIRGLGASPLYRVNQMRGIPSARHGVLEDLNGGKR